MLGAFLLVERNGQKMNYTQVCEYIEECNKLGSVLGLESIERLAKEVGNPQDDLKIIHIAGTNGKGSVLAYLSTVLQESGYRVGRYLSPTIFEYRERFQINERMIGKTALAGYLQELKEACDKIVSNGYPHPTAFEIETVLAFLYFKEKKCDLVVLETGMGGSLDATNIVKTTILSVITSISMDHMAFLGNTLEEITNNKCGIIKPGVSVVTMEQNQEVLDTIRSHCAQKQSPLTVANRNEISRIHYGLNKQSFQYKGQKYTISLAGTYQLWNAALSVKALELLRMNGFHKLTEQTIQKGLLNTVWRGRFEIISSKPLFIVDGAHNADAALQLKQSIEFYFTNKRIIYIMGVFKDKEYDKVIETTAQLAEQIITVATPNNARALPSIELAKAVSRVNRKVTSADSLEEAVEMAYLFADSDSVIIAFGSLSFSGEIIRIVENGKTVRSDTHGK